MRILELGAHGGFGGGERVMFNIVNELKEDYDFLVVAPRGDFLSEFKKEGSDVIELRSESLVDNFFNLRNLFKNIEPDIIHCHGTRAAFWARFIFLTMWRRPKLIYTLHGLHLSKYKFPKKNIFLWLERLFNFFVDEMVCVSDADREEVLEYNLINDKKITVIKNGINIDEFTAKINSNNFKKEFTVTTVSRLHRQKDVATIIKAIKLLKDDSVGVVLNIIGDGPLRGDLENLVRDFGLSNCVNFLGWRNDIPEIMSASDVIVLSSNWEAFGLVCVEAGAAQKPIIASDIPGIREAVVDGETGFLFEQGSEKDLALKIKSFINDQELGRKMGNAGREFVQQNFTIGKMAKNYQKLFEPNVLQMVKLYTPVIGGVEKIAQDLAEGLGTGVLCCQKWGRGVIEKVNGVTVHRSSSFGMFWGMPVSISFIWNWFRLRSKVDVVDFHAPFPLGDLALFLFRPKKLIVHYHSDIVRQKMLEIFFRPLIMSTLRRADKIVVSSPNLKNTSEYLKGFQNKTEVIPFGLDLKKYSNFNQARVNQIKNKYGKFVLYVGRFGYYKGLEYLVEAMKNVDENLVMIGDGPERETIRQLIVENQLSNRVHLLPFQDQDELRNYFHAARVFVLPSIFRSEAFGIVLMEALACGTPLISTELGTGTSWVNQNSETGIVVESKNSQELSGAINKILHSNSLYEKMNHSALSRARDQFDIRKMLEKTKNLYKT